MTPPAFRIAAMLAAMAASTLLIGCTSLPFNPSVSALTAHSQTQPGARLTGEFEHAFYSYGDRDTITVVLINGPIDQPTQAATIRMFWRPRAGSTPVSATATNASVQYVVFASPADAADTPVGVYSGAGFFFLTSPAGHPTLRGELWQANLRLADGTDSFNDRLGQAVLTGDITARRDDAAVNDLLHQLSTLVTQHLGYPRLVRADR